MVSAATLALQGNDIRQLQSTTPILRIIAKTLGSVGSQTGGNAPALTRQQWITDTSDLEGVAESDLLAFIADQLARMLIQNGEPGLYVTGDRVKLAASTELAIKTPFVAAGTTIPGQPLTLLNASTGLCEFSPLLESALSASPLSVNAGRALLDSDNGRTLLVTSATDVTITAAATLQAGFITRIVRMGAGEVTIAAGAGTTVSSQQSRLRIEHQYGVVSLVKTSASQFVAHGDLKA